MSLMTVDDFLEMPEKEARKHELWQGERTHVSEKKPYEDWIRGSIVFELMQCAATCGALVLSTTGVQLDSNTVTRPDVCFWDAAHTAMLAMRVGPTLVVPQLIVEVVSPSDSMTEVFRKARYAIRSGVHTVWVMMPEPFEIHVFETPDIRRIVRAGEKLEAPGVLPGFSVDAAQFVPPGFQSFR